MNKGQLIHFQCPVCKRKRPYVYKGGSIRYSCTECRLLLGRFTPLSFPGWIDLEKFPKISAHSYKRKGIKSTTTLRITVYLDKIAVPLLSMAIPNSQDKLLTEIVRVINETSDATRLCCALLQIVRNIVHGTWLNLFYRRYGKVEGLSDYQRRNWVPKYVNKYKVLRDLRKEIKNLKGRLDHGID